ncbi:MAG: hypothetical protein GF317_10180, partial [Candidatus Lokiarchaeota archaeon]|nr:hypothetical protein [Candidatus Lokiarchaeota archaeon]MBD3200027.1 hypothetical protein [Candidatus Lokiarchaeota archaeon]
LTFLISLINMIFLDISSRIFSFNGMFVALEPLLPIFSSFMFQGMGIFLISRVWVKKDYYLEKYGEKAYQKSILYILTGIPMFVSSMLHGFIPFNSPWFPSPNNPLTIVLGTPILDYIFAQILFLDFLRLLFGVAILILGLATAIRSLFIFGFDYMALIYLYYPEKSRVVNNKIYSVIRHPAYHGLILVSISSILFRFSIYSILICLLFIIGMNFHIKFIEEKELIDRFEESYREYMKTTPALFFHPKHLKDYFVFLMGIKN